MCCQFSEALLDAREALKDTPEAAQFTWRPNDIRGILGADSDVRNGYDDIGVTFHVDADASRHEVEALVAQSQKRSAVFDALTNPTNVTVEVA